MNKWELSDVNIVIAGSEVKVDSQYIDVARNNITAQPLMLCTLSPGFWGSVAVLRQRTVVVVVCVCMYVCMYG